MGVYLYPNNVQKELKNWYIWEYIEDRPDITTMQYTNKSISVVSANETQWLYISPDWTNLYYCDFGDAYVRQYSMSTAWDISTATNTGKYITAGYSGGGWTSWVALSPDGTKMYVSLQSNWISEFTLSTARDVSTASLSNTLSVSGNLPWLWVSQDWQHIYFTNFTTSKLVEYNMSTPRDLSTATLLWQISYPVAWWVYRDVCVSPDKKVYLVQQATPSYIYQLDMSTAQDITTATYSGASSSVTHTAWWLYISPNGKRMYVSSLDGKTIYQYSLG